MTQKIIPYGPITLLISNKSDNIHVMTRKFLGLVFYSATLLMGVVAIESSCSQATTDWGPNFGGIQLSIELSTNTVTAGSEVIFFMRIKNSSSDIARLNNEETKLIVTNSSGKAYQLIKGFNVYNPKVNLVVNEGEIKEWSLPVKFGEDIVPGDYVFPPITRDITTADKKVYTLKSNSLKVKIMK